MSSQLRSVPVESGPRKKTHPAGRVCGHPGCDTVLSVYNPEDFCGEHDTALAAAQRERFEAARGAVDAHVEPPAPEPEPDPEPEPEPAEPESVVPPENDDPTLVLDVLGRAGIFLSRREIFDRVLRDHGVLAAGGLDAALKSGEVVKTGRASGTKYGLAGWFRGGEPEPTPEPDPAPAAAPAPAPELEPPADPEPAPAPEPPAPRPVPLSAQEVYVDSDDDLTSYAEMLVGMREVLRFNYERYLIALIDRLEQGYDWQIADRIERVLADIKGMVE